MLRLLLITFLLVGCGDKIIKTVTEPSQPCTVTQVAEGALITCPDGSQSVVYNGTNGSKGETGTDGTDGVDGSDGEAAEICTVEEVDDGAKITCGDKSAVVKNGKNGNDGTDGAAGSDGVDGVDGTDGQDGVDGADGESPAPCKVESTDTGIKVTCGTSTAYVNNGKDGVDGTDGQDGTNGQDGVDGQDGSSCSVTRSKDEAKISCTDGTETTIKFQTIKVITIPVDKFIKKDDRDSKHNNKGDKND
jgi:hypothetical protein